MESWHWASLAYRSFVIVFLLLLLLLLMPRLNLQATGKQPEKGNSVELFKCWLSKPGSLKHIQQSHEHYKKQCKHFEHVELINSNDFHICGTINMIQWAKIVTTYDTHRETQNKKEEKIIPYQNESHKVIFYSCIVTDWHFKPYVSVLRLFMQ